MRVSAEAKRETRSRTLEAARRLFVRDGFDATTTRGLASEAGIAAGTLFNYYESKEALAVALVSAALEAGREDYRKGLRGDEGLDEALFLHVIAGLRRLEPYRGFVGAVLETALSPFGSAGGRSGVGRLGDELRSNHLEVVADLIAGAREGSEASAFVTLHLYWTLYLGVMAFWAGDDSPKQEDTLAVLDESLRVFALALSTPPVGPLPRDE